MQAFAKHGARVFLAARTPSKAESAISEIKTAVPDANITFLELDLASFESISKAVETFKASSDRLDILMNNAGVFGLPNGLTKDGYEVHFGTNHMGHALLIKLLLPTLQSTAEKPDSDVRIINLSSDGHMTPPKGGLILEGVTTAQEKYGTLPLYGQSKLANILYTRELAKRFPEIKTVAVHPGVVDTGLTLTFQQSNSWWAKPAYSVLKAVILTTPERGARTQLWCATSKETKTGVYYIPVGKENAGSGYSRDEKLVNELWEYTEKELAKHGY